MSETAPNPIPDERRTAPAVREWVSHGPKKLAEDRTALARKLHSDGLNRMELADILGVDWAQVDQILGGDG